MANQVFEILKKKIIITEENLKSLEKLFASSNEIKHFENDSFINLHHLIIMDMSYNEITFIEKDWNKNIRKLTDLYLHGNKLTFIREIL